MPAVSFPTSPTVGQQVTINNKIYTWNGKVWDSSVSASTIFNLDDLLDVSVSGVSNGNVLRFNGSNWTNGTVSSPSTSLSSLTDVNVSGAVNNNYLKFNGTNWTPSNVTSSFSGLSDVNVTGVVANNTLRWDGTKWVPQTANINFLTDVDTVTTAPVNGNYLRWNGTNWVPQTFPNIPSSIDNLSDVNTSTVAPVNNSLLKYNGTNWVPGQAYTGITSATPPAFNTIIPGTVWINSDTLEQFIYVVDGSGNNVWISFGNPNASSVFSLSDMSDVSITSPVNGNYLYYDSSTYKWKNTVLPVLAAGRNKIINGDMRISQKFKGGSIANDNYTFDYVVDKFFTYSFTSNGLYTSGRNLHGSLPGSGFDNYLGVRVGSSGYNFAANASTYGGVNYMLEGLDVADLKLGTADAKPFTVSFWYYSSVAGTYNLLIRSRITGSTAWANNRFYIHSFTVPASTWTYVTATIPAVTSGSNWTTNAGGMGMYLTWMLGAGSNYTGATSGVWYAPPSQFIFPYQTNTATQFLATANATMALTGVQLESGSTATAFETLDYQASLNKCKRFYFDYKYTNNSTLEPIAQGVVGSSTNQAFAYINFQTEMAKLPAIAMSGAIMAYDYSTATSINVSSVSINQYGKNNAVVMFTLASNSVSGRTLTFFANSSNGVFSVDANLAQADA